MMGRERLISSSRLVPLATLALTWGTAFAQMNNASMPVGPVSPPALSWPLPHGNDVPGATVEEAIDACVASDMRNTATPGAALAVMLDGMPLYERGYGFKHEVTGGAVGARTVFRIGSITKQMTAAALLQQVEAGRVQLDDVLETWAGRPIASAARGQNLTSRHLLNHTSGIPDFRFTLHGRTDDGALEAWVDDSLPIAFWSPPGVFWNYSNPNYVLAGWVAERASGIPFRTLMQTGIFNAAGLADTTLDPQQVVARGDFAWGHFRDPITGAQVIFSPTDYDNAAIAPAGYAFSSAPDLVSWAKLLLDGGGAVLAPSSVAELVGSRVSRDERPDQQYGLGVFREEYGGHEVFHHEGNIPGWGAMLMWVPQRRFAVALLGNGLASLSRGAYCVMEKVLGLTSGAPPDVTTDPSLWHGFAGTYHGKDILERPFTAVVSLSASKLWMTVNGLGSPTPFSASLTQQNPDVFLMDVNGDGIPDQDITFIRSGGSGATTKYLRNRLFVGERLFSARRKLKRQESETSGSPAEPVPQSTAAGTTRHGRMQ